MAPARTSRAQPSTWVRPEALDRSAGCRPNPGEAAAESLSQKRPRPRLGELLGDSGATSTDVGGGRSILGRPRATFRRFSRIWTNSADFPQGRPIPRVRRFVGGACNVRRFRPTRKIQSPPIKHCVPRPTARSHLVSKTSYHPRLGWFHRAGRSRASLACGAERAGSPPASLFAKSLEPPEPQTRRPPRERRARVAHPSGGRVGGKHA